MVWGEEVEVVSDEDRGASGDGVNVQSCLCSQEEPSCP